MAVRTIVTFPDPRLRQPAEAVAAFDEDLRALAADLVDSMAAAQGIGITGPHIGCLRRVVVIALEDGAGPRIYVNPQVEWASPETARHDEGSVSMPGVIEAIERPARVRVGYQDLEGAAQTVEADGLLAVCLLHEIDQLDGIFWIQRLSRLRRERVVGRFAKLQRAAGR